MKLQIGKTYVTRNRKHRVRITEKGNGRHGMVGEDQNGKTHAFSPAGRSHIGQESPLDLVEEIPVFSFEAGQTYETKEGTEITILHTGLNLWGGYTTVGIGQAANNPPGVLAVHIYDDYGRAQLSRPECDITRESRPKVPWHHVPPYMRFWAVDRDNGQCYFSGKPAYDPADGIWRGPDYWRLPKEHRIPYAGKPENSLTERPSE